MILQLQSSVVAGRRVPQPKRGALPTTVRRSRMVTRAAVSRWISALHSIEAADGVVGVVAALPEFSDPSKIL